MSAADDAGVWTEPEFAAALELAATGVIQAPGVRLDERRLRRLMEAIPADEDGRRHFLEVNLEDAVLDGPALFGEAFFGRKANFKSATFNQAAWFERTSFEGDAEFSNATFKANARFARATVNGEAAFSEAAFEGDAVFHLLSARESSFGKAVFHHVSGFQRASFGRIAYFEDAVFSGNARFDEATFGVHGGELDEWAPDTSAMFARTTFNGNADFSAAVFSRDAGFIDATFCGATDFIDTTFWRNVSFRRAKFERSRALGYLLVGNFVDLMLTVFSEPVSIVLSARLARLDGAVFAAGADIFARWADLRLEDADFRAPSLLTEIPAADVSSSRGSRPFLGAEAPDGADGWICHIGRPPTGFAPRVVSLRRAKVANLTLSAVDLRRCRFVGAHGIDSLKLERTRFAQPPEGFRQRSPWRWTRRQTLMEEYVWRHANGHGSGWDPAEGTAALSPPQPEAIAVVYRALRKAREEGKDEPGAADFYYGEMEMRRHRSRRTNDDRSHPVSRGERVTLFLYWLVAGYGLRSSRALGALAITLIVLAGALSLWGFSPDRSYGDSLLFAAQDSISLLGAPATKLTTGGQIIEIALRLAGPLFFGLALLSVRGRIKR